MISRPSALALLALLALAACAGVRAPATQPEPALAPQRFALAGSTVRVQDLAGEVRIQPGTGPEVVVTVTRAGRDASALAVEHDSPPAGDALRVVAPASARRLYYPALPGRSDSVEFRASAGGLKPGKGGFLGLFASRRTTKVVRRPGAGALDAHADIVVALPPGRRLDVQLGAGRVAVGGVAGDVRALLLAGAAEATGSAGRLRLTSNSGGITVTGGGGVLTVESAAGSVEVDGFHGAYLAATTGAGAVAGADLSADSLLVRTGAGDIALERVRAGRLDLGSGAGELRLGDVAADTLRARSGVGSLTLRAVRAAVLAVEARKGNAEVGLTALPGSARIRADGAAVLALPPGASADLSLKSDHGRLLLEAPVASRSGAGQHVLARLGHGGTRIDVRAEHDVTLREEEIVAGPAAPR